jgi:hypothetical protein
MTASLLLFAMSGRGATGSRRKSLLKTRTATPRELASDSLVSRQEADFSRFFAELNIKRKTLGGSGSRSTQSKSGRKSSKDGSRLGRLDGSTSVPPCALIVFCSTSPSAQVREGHFDSGSSGTFACFAFGTRNGGTCRTVEQFPRNYLA